MLVERAPEKFERGFICAVRGDFGFIENAQHTACVFFHVNDLVDLKYGLWVLSARELRAPLPHPHVPSNSCVRVLGSCGLRASALLAHALRSTRSVCTMIWLPDLPTLA